MPPQIPYASRASSAYSRHSARTGQRLHTALAASSRSRFSLTVSACSGPKNRVGSMPLHSARSCQRASSSRDASLEASALVVFVVFLDGCSSLVTSSLVPGALRLCSSSALHSTLGPLCWFHPPGGGGPTDIAENRFDSQNSQRRARMVRSEVDATVGLRSTCFSIPIIQAM